MLEETANVTQGGRFFPWPSIYNEELKSLPGRAHFSLFAGTRWYRRSHGKTPKVQTVPIQLASMILAVVSSS